MITIPDELISMFIGTFVGLILIIIALATHISKESKNPISQEDWTIIKKAIDEYGIDEVLKHAKKDDNK